MIRVLVVTPDYPPGLGGIQLLMHRLVTNLEGVEPSVVTLANANAPAAPGPDEVSVRRVASQDSTKNRLAVARLNASGLLAGLRLRPQVVISGHAVTAPAASAVRRLTGARMLQYLHADEFRQRPGLVKLGVRNADAVIAVSRYTRQMALDVGCEEAKLHLVHPGVDPAAPSGATKAEAPTILTVARMAERYKGHDVMVKALGPIRERSPQARWVVVGDGPLRPWLEERVGAEGLTDAVSFVGRVTHSERDDWFDRAHVFAMPSRVPDDGTGGEGFGIVYLEAASHGLPSVAGAVAGAQDAVVDGETGILVDPADHLEVADAIVGLLTDPERAAALGARGAERAREFTWQHHAAAVRELIDEVTRQ